MGVREIRTDTHPNSAVLMIGLHYIDKPTVLVLRTYSYGATRYFAHTLRFSCLYKSIMIRISIDHDYLIIQ